MTRRATRSTPFPYTTLFRSDVVVVEAHQVPVGGDVEVGLEMVGAGLEGAAEGDHRVLRPEDPAAPVSDQPTRTPEIGEMGHGAILSLPGRLSERGPVLDDPP